MRQALTALAVVALCAVGCGGRRIAVAPAADVHIQNGPWAGHDGLRIQAASDGRWFAATQDPPPEAGARASRASWLKIGTERAVPIRSLVATSADQRWIVVDQGGVATLIDTVTGTRRDLHGARLYPVVGRSNSLRGEAAMTGEFLVYLRARGRADRLVIHRLADGSERELPLPGPVGEIDLDANAPFGGVTMLIEDTDRSGQLEWPTFTVSHGPNRRIPAPWRTESAPSNGDWPALFWLDLDRARLVRMDDLVCTAGTSRILRAPDGGLRWVKDSGHESFQTAAPKGAQLVAIDVPSASLVVARDRRIEVVRAGGVTAFEGFRPPLFAMVAVVFGRASCTPTEDGFVVSGLVGRTDGTFPGWLLDVRRLRLTDVGFSNPLYSHREFALFGDEGKVPFILDGRDGSRTSIDLLPGDPSSAAAGALFVLRGNVIDLPQRKVVGHCRGRWFAIDTSARCLTYEPELGKPFDPDKHLVWRAAVPATTR